MNRGGGRSFLAGNPTAKLAHLSSRVAPPVWVITRQGSQGHVYKDKISESFDFAKSPKCRDVNIFDFSGRVTTADAKRIIKCKFDHFNCNNGNASRSTY